MGGIRSVGGQLASGSEDGNVILWSLAGVEDDAAQSDPRIRATLVGLPEGWAAIAPDGRYKAEGTIGGAFWWVIGMCRFEIGELDPYLREIAQVAADVPL
ncbi:hypothetical protein [Nocardia macrotermitis]|uniref:Uncharacterized protein n=1 Tax=Nocardia macrotermitis TaxID=2585198 RepID=A0A7K0D844_9NOCA|nr:hypothetical protein [Nocardia macrotermitis]MQY21953.1 hypothetical protein [Nocardia macrotermitis]